jgi:hypothetical protein
MIDTSVSVPALDPLIAQALQAQLPCDPWEIRALQDGSAIDIASLAFAINRGRVHADLDLWNGDRVADALKARARHDAGGYDIPRLDGTPHMRGFVILEAAATRRLPLLATIMPGGQAVLLDGGRRFGVVEPFKLASFPVRVVPWEQTIRYQLLPPTRRNHRSDKPWAFRFLKHSLDHGPSAVIGHNIRDAGPAMAVIGQIRLSRTNKEKDQNLVRLWNNGIVNLLRIIHYTGELNRNRRLSDETQAERLSWPAEFADFLPGISEIKKRYAAQAIQEVLGVRNLPAARRLFDAELAGCSRAHISAKIEDAKRFQHHLSVAYKVTQDWLAAALKAYRAEEGRHESFNNDIPYLHRLGATELKGHRHNPHALHDHFHRQFERLESARMNIDDVRRLACRTGVSLGEYLNRHARERCLMDWFAAVARATRIEDLKVEPMAAHRFIMRRRLATEGSDQHSISWHELFQHVLLRFDLAALDRRCFMIATGRNCLIA